MAKLIAADENILDSIRSKLLKDLFPDREKPMQPSTDANLLQNMLIQSLPEPTEEVLPSGEIKTDYPQKDETNPDGSLKRWFTQGVLGDMGEFKYLGKDFDVQQNPQGESFVPASDVMGVQNMLKGNYNRAKDEFKDPTNKLKELDVTTLDSDKIDKILQYARNAEQKALSKANYGQRNFNPDLVDLYLEEELGGFLPLASKAAEYKEAMKLVPQEKQTKIEAFKKEAMDAISRGADKEAVLKELQNDLKMYGGQ
jgi:hypothetical protein